MMLLASLLVPILLLTPPGAAEQAQAVFRDPVFEITMPPGAPLPTATKTADASGADYSAETKGGIYRIQYIDMPGPDVESLFSRILGSFKDQFRLESQNRFTHQGYPAMSLTISQSTPKQVMRMNCYVANNRLLRVWFIAKTTAELDAPAVRAFFDSLRIKNAKG